MPSWLPASVLIGPEGTGRKTSVARIAATATNSTPGEGGAAFQRSWTFAKLSPAKANSTNGKTSTSATSNRGLTSGLVIVARVE